MCAEYQRVQSHHLNFPVKLRAASELCFNQDQGLEDVLAVHVKAISPFIIINENDSFVFGGTYSSGGNPIPHIFQLFNQASQVWLTRWHQANFGYPFIFGNIAVSNRLYPYNSSESFAAWQIDVRFQLTPSLASRACTRWDIVRRGATVGRKKHTDWLWVITPCTPI